MSTTTAPQEGQQVTIEELTPELAEKLLEANHGNRPVSMSQVENLSRLMLEGLWRFNGDAIRIAVDGTLLDGQHRCMACARSRVTLPQQVIVRGLPNESQATMDQGRKRSAGDVLAMSKFTNGNQIASVARLVHEWKSGRRGINELGKSRVPLTPDEIRMWAERDENLNKAALFSTRTAMRALASPKAVGTLWFLTNESDAEKCAAFFEQLESGAGLEKGNPILTVRNFWQNLRVQGSVPVPRYLDAGVRAWNRWMVGENLSMISQRMERDIPDVYVPPGRPDTVNTFAVEQADATPAQLAPAPAPAPARKAAPARPKRRIASPGGDGSLFSER